MGDMVKYSMKCKALEGHVEYEQKGKRQHRCQKCGLYLYPSTQKLCKDFVPHNNVKSSIMGLDHERGW